MACLLLSAGGCNTLSALGVPISGPHRLLGVTSRMRDAAGYPIELPRELNKTVLADYIVEPGDVLLVESADFNAPVRLPAGDQTVQPDGIIDLGKYGRLIAAGKTVPQLEAEVRDQIRREHPDAAEDVTVRLVSWDSKVYYVLGEVNSPGAYPLTGRETVLDALVAAGELTDRGNRHRIILSRPSLPEDCRQVLPICYQHIVQLGDTASNYQIQPGDRIFVPSMTLWQDLMQTLSPACFDRCPRCGGSQIPCHDNCPPGQCLHAVSAEP